MQARSQGRVARASIRRVVRQCTRPKTAMRKASRGKLATVDLFSHALRPRCSANEPRNDAALYGRPPTVTPSFRIGAKLRTSELCSDGGPGDPARTWASAPQAAKALCKPGVDHD